MARYSAAAGAGGGGADVVDEFKTLVRECHRRGIEVRRAYPDPSLRPGLRHRGLLGGRSDMRNSGRGKAGRGQVAAVRASCLMPQVRGTASATRLRALVFSAISACAAGHTGRGVQPHRRGQREGAHARVPVRACWSALRCIASLRACPTQSTACVQAEISNTGILLPSEHHRRLAACRGGQAPSLRFECWGVLNCS